jgi:tetratricopeptide (TPR) repeat protein
VPLILAGGGLPAGRVVSELVRTVDLAPTLLELAGAPPLPGDGGASIDGESLLPLLAMNEETAGTAAPRISYSESFLPLYAYRWYPLRALSDGRWLYVDAPRPRLFDLAADPAETAEVAAGSPRHREQGPRWAAALARRLESWGEAERVPEPEPLTEEQRRALEALGYVGGGGGRPESLAGLPDPYDVVDIAARLHELAPRVQRQECGGETLEELRRILRRNRDNLPALNMAGICRMGEGEYEAALPYFRHAVQVHPQSTIARANLAGCLLRLGRREEAESAYRETLALDPAVPQAVANLARLLREAGRPKEAMAVLEAAFAAGGSQVPWFLERGLLYAEARRLPRALADFERVLQAEPANPTALGNAARAAYLLGDARRAAALYTRLVTLEPGGLEAWKTLGAIQLYELGDVAGARSSFTRALALETDPAERRELEEILEELRE